MDKIISFFSFQKDYLKTFGVSILSKQFTKSMRFSTLSNE